MKKGHCSIRFKLFYLILVTALTSCANGSRISSGDNYALVIGNSNYHNIADLKNPVNDARAISGALRSLGYKVDLFTNLTQQELNRTTTNFVSKLVRNSATIGFFYYAGHSSQADGQNYLTPIDARAQSIEELKNRSFSLNPFLRKLGNSNSEAYIIVLDACRNNPFKDSILAATTNLYDGADRRIVRERVSKVAHSFGNGLAELEAPANTFISFATKPGRTAKDGLGSNSIFTQALVERIVVEGLTIEQVFKDVRRRVSNRTNGMQIPFDNSSLYGQIYFKKRKSIPVGW